MICFYVLYLFKLLSSILFLILYGNFCFVSCSKLLYYNSVLFSSFSTPFSFNVTVNLFVSLYLKVIDTDFFLKHYELKN